MLSRVNEPLLDVAKALERVVDRRDFHVVRPRADDMDGERSAGHSEESRSALDEQFRPRRLLRCPLDMPLVPEGEGEQSPELAAAILTPGDVIVQ
jgi:hypothetical protein